MSSHTETAGTSRHATTTRQLVIIKAAAKATVSGGSGVEWGGAYLQCQQSEETVDQVDRRHEQHVRTTTADSVK